MPRPAVRSRCAQAKTLGLKLMGPWAFADDISWENPPDAKKTSRVYQALTFKSRAPKSLDQLICWEVESPCWKNVRRSKVVLQQLVGCGRGGTRPHWTISCLSKWPGQRLVLCHSLGMRYSTGGGCLGYPFSVDAEGYREVIKGHCLKGVPKPGETDFL